MDQHLSVEPAARREPAQALTPEAAEATMRLQAALVTHMSDAFIATTVTGEITSWNPAAEEIYGRTAARALGLPINEAVGAPLNPAGIVAAGGVEHTTHRAVDGSALTMRVSVAPMSDGYVVLCADQTALRRAEQHFQTVVTSLGGGVVVIAANGEVESVNPAALRIMGVPETGVDAVEFAKLASVSIYDSDGILLSPDQRPVLRTLTDIRAGPPSMALTAWWTANGSGCRCRGRRSTPPTRSEHRC